jgi:hypothetical protein
MFRSDQQRSSYPGALSRNKIPYVLLFGPPIATRAAAEALRREGVQTFGHLFHPTRVDFGPDAGAPPGLGPEDTAIRDYDPSLYLARVLGRSGRLVGFEQGVGDSPTVSYLVHDDPNCLFVACLPRPEILGPPDRWTEEHWSFFLSLCFSQAEAPFIEIAAAWLELIESLGGGRRSEYELRHYEFAQLEIIPWLRSKGLVTAGKPNFLVLPWGSGPPGQQQAVKAWRSVQDRWQHAPEVVPGAIEAAIEALSGLDIEDAIAAGAPIYRDRISGLMTELGLSRTSREPRELHPGERRHWATRQVKNNAG